MKISITKNNDDFKTKNFLHFDKRQKFNYVKSYVESPDKVSLHSFLPFIRFVYSFEKFHDQGFTDMSNESVRPIKSKSRDIMYAGHLDGYIYKHYSNMLNTYYNDLALLYDINQNSLAYRNNKPKQSNIDFSAKIINQIMDYGSAYIMIGDFTNFFDRIDHSILKRNLITVLNVNRLENNNTLPDDWYNVFRSVTKFGYYEKQLINEFCGTDKVIRANKHTRYFNTLKEFRTFQKKHKTMRNKNRYAIPQGTAISGVLANIYAINFDLELVKIAKQYKGNYQRYSDDFILVIPKNEGHKVDLKTFIQITKQVNEIAKMNAIELQDTKTNSFEFGDSRITSLGSNNKTNMDYLGFIFDGNTVRMRGKSPYKFYRQAYKLIKKAHNKKDKENLSYLPYKKRIYTLYTDLGTIRRPSPFGNFISYAQRAQSKFDTLSPHTNNLMINQIRNRKKKIEKHLNMKLHTKI